MIKELYLFILFILILSGCVDNIPVSGEYPKKGMASWYVANDELTCAMRKANYGKNFKVCNIANDKCVIVMHTDFGPVKRLYNKGRIIDLNKLAFAQISDLDFGLINVTVEEVKKEN